MTLDQENPVAPKRVRTVPLGHDARTIARLVDKGPLSPEIGVTCRGKVDGAGAQAMAVISGLAMARFVGCRYLHSPFTSMAHALGARDDWARRWESFLNFGDGEPLVPRDAELVQVRDVTADPARHAGRPIVIVARVFGLPGEEGTRTREALRPVLRAKYWRSSKAAIPSHRGPAGGFTIAIHVRRGDVTSARNANRYVSDAIVLRQIGRIKRALAPFGKPVTFNVYSEGAAEDFRQFAEAGCILHISQDPFETFHNMVTADVLLGAYSTFTYVAALLSEGIVLDHRIRQPRHSNWIGRRHDRNISIKRLRSALLKRMSWPARATFRLSRFWQRHSPFRGRTG